MYTEYGPPDVLKLKEVQVPDPKGSEVLVKVYATTATSGDVSLRSMNVPSPLFRLLGRINYGLRRPKKTILGSDFAGVVEKVGHEVTRFEKGDPVFGTTTIDELGAYAEYVCVPEDGLLVRKPAGLTYEETAPVCHGGLSALYFLGKADIQRGQRVLINGASGGVGTFAVQLARHYGAEVTGVCSTSNVDLVLSLGADKVVDYTKEDFTASGQTYDVVFDTVGKMSFTRCKGSLADGGTFLATVWGLREVGQMLWTSVVGSKKVVVGVAPEFAQDLAFLKELIEAGRMKTAVDRRYPLEQMVEAHRFVEKGHKKRHVVITVQNGSISQK